MYGKQYFKMKTALKRRQALEGKLEKLFTRIGKVQTAVADTAVKGNAFYLKQKYTGLQNDYFDMTGKFYEPTERFK